jgi:hypothetical protein
VLIRSLSAIGATLWPAGVSMLRVPFPAAPCAYYEQLLFDRNRRLENVSWIALRISA